MEELVNVQDWRGRRVFLTGDTGFKGSWLALLLSELGAEVTGYALPPATRPSLFAEARIGDLIRHIDGDLRDCDTVATAVRDAAPEVVFHLGAQPLVLHSYAHPVETYATNVMGTVHLLEACRGVAGLKAVVVVTSDKCYENREWVWPYRETDPMGGHDPYSSSKGAAELVVAAYRRSFFATAGAAGVATVRAGNVIGGGDWADDRLIPDILRALEAGERPLIRSPNAVRPWQHVLEALGGYVMIAERLLGGDASAASGWNFGPAQDDARPVHWIADEIVRLWGGDGWDRVGGEEQRHEAKILQLDSSRARQELLWRPTMNLGLALERVVEWHRARRHGQDAREITLGQIRQFRAALSGLRRNTGAIDAR